MLQSLGAVALVRSPDVRDTQVGPDLTWFHQVGKALLYVIEERMPEFHSLPSGIFPEGSCKTGSDVERIIGMEFEQHPDDGTLKAMALFINCLMVACTSEFGIS